MGNPTDSNRKRKKNFPTNGTFGSIQNFVILVRASLFRILLLQIRFEIFCFEKASSFGLANLVLVLIMFILINVIICKS